MTTSDMHSYRRGGGGAGKPRNAGIFLKPIFLSVFVSMGSARLQIFYRKNVTRYAVHYFFNMSVLFV